MSNAETHSVRRSTRKKTVPVLYCDSPGKSTSKHSNGEIATALVKKKLDDFYSESTDEDETSNSLTEIKTKLPAFIVSSSDDESSVDDNESGKPKKSRNKPNNQQYTDRYFVDQCITTGTKGKPLSSHNQLTKLKDKKLGIEEIKSLLKAHGETHPIERNTLLEEHLDLFERWLDLLEDGFNVILYGVGSKKLLLERFSNDKLSNNYYIVVHGFFPGSTLKQILNSITEDILKDNCSFPSVFHQTEFILNNLKLLRQDVFIVMHNIDGVVFSVDKTMTVLSQLATCKHIHFIATVDHVNSGLLFDSVKLSKFNWVWFNVSTFDSYKVEMSNENSMLLQQCEKLELSSLQHVYKSLTPNAQNIFELLARNQLENSLDSNFLGMSFAALFRECREGFFVNSELTLTAQLTEYKDHNMLRTRKGGDGVEYLYIPLDKNTLKQFLNQLDEI